MRKWVSSVVLGVTCLSTLGRLEPTSADDQPFLCEGGGRAASHQLQVSGSGRFLNLSSEQNKALECALLEMEKKQLKWINLTLDNDLNIRLQASPRNRPRTE